MRSSWRRSAASRAAADWRGDWRRLRLSSRSFRSAANQRRRLADRAETLEHRQHAADRREQRGFRRMR